MPEFGQPAHIVFNFPVPADPIPLPERVAAGRVSAVPGNGSRAIAAPAVARLSGAKTGLAGRLTRRTALASLAATGAALAVAGCTPKQTTPAADLIAGDALGPIYTETSQLIATYDRTLASAPELVDLLGPLREEHRQHLIALASLIGLAMPAVSTGPHPSGIPLPPPNPTESPSLPSSTNPAATSPGSTPPPPAGSATASTPPGSPATSTSTPLPSGAPPSGVSPAVIKAQLSAAEKTAQTNAVVACISVAAERVPIIAAIAACRATHVAALR